jgi:hypothetical protein
MTDGDSVRSKKENICSGATIRTRRERIKMGSLEGSRRFQGLRNTRQDGLIREESKKSRIEREGR